MNKSTIRFVSLVVVALALLFTTGCVAVNNGNLNTKTPPLKYEKDEKSEEIKETKHIVNGKVVEETIEKTTRTGLAVKEGVEHHRLDVIEEVGKRKAESTSGGFLSRLFGSRSVVVGNPYPYNSYYPGYPGNNGGGDGGLGGRNVIF